MLTLIAAVILGIVGAYFATQNPGYTDINLLGYAYHIPLYLLVLGSLLIGLLVASLVQIGDILSSSLTLMNKEGELKNSQKSLNYLKDRVNQLELENARLRSKDNEIILDSTPQAHEEVRTKPFGRLKRNFSLKGF